jgi:hypothetical protein
MNEMQSKYRIVKEKNKYNIFETMTEQVLFSKDSYEEARKWIRRMNRISFGFAGWTPSFILTKFTAPGM